MTELDRDDLPKLDTISCSFGTESFDIKFSPNAKTLKRTISAALATSDGDIVGLKNKNLVYPIEFVASSGGEHPELYLFSTFEVLVDPKSKDTDSIPFVPGKESQEDLKLFQTVTLKDMLFVMQIRESLDLCDVAISDFSTFCKTFQVNGIITKSNYDLLLWNLLPKNLIADESMVVDDIFFHFSKLFLILTRLEGCMLGVPKKQKHCEFDNEFQCDEIDFHLIYLALLVMLPISFEDKCNEFVSTLDVEDCSCIHLQSFETFASAIFALQCSFLSKNSAKDMDQYCNMIILQVNQVTTQFQRYVSKQEPKGRKKSKYIITERQICDWYFSGGKHQLGILLFFCNEESVEEAHSLDSYNYSQDKSMGMSRISNPTTEPLFLLQFGEDQQFEVASDSKDLLKRILDASINLGNISLHQVAAKIQNLSLGVKFSGKDCTFLYRSILASYESSKPNASTHKEIELYLLRLRDALFIESQDCISKLTWLSSLCLFCKGSKSEKLWFLFQIGIEKSRGLRGDELGDIFLAFLFSVICTNLSLDNGLLTQWQVFLKRYTISLAKDIVSKFLEETDPLKSNTVKTLNVSNFYVTFEQFSQWYNEVGRNSANWIELLDLAKWTIVRPSLGSSQTCVRKMISTFAQTEATFNETKLLELLDLQANDTMLDLKGISVSKSIFLRLAESSFKTLNKFVKALKREIYANLENISQQGTEAQDSIEQWLVQCTKAADYFEKEDEVLMAGKCFFMFTLHQNIRNLVSHDILFGEITKIDCLVFIQILLCSLILCKKGHLDNSSFRVIRETTHDIIFGKPKNLSDMLKTSKRMLPQTCFILFGKNICLREEDATIRFDLSTNDTHGFIFLVFQKSSTLLGDIYNKDFVSVSTFFSRVRKLAPSPQDNDSMNLWNLISETHPPSSWDIFLGRLGTAFKSEIFDGVYKSYWMMSLIVLLPGKKSIKLELAFQFLANTLSEGSSSSSMNETNLAMFFAMFLCVLYCINTSTKPDILLKIKSHCNLMASRAIQELSLESVQFNEVAYWYSISGHSGMPWIELIDLTKWFN